MIYLGVDPGFVNIGYFILNSHNQEVTYGTVISKHSAFEDKLVNIYNNFTELLTRYKVSVLIYEQPIFNQKGTTGQNINRAVGVVLLAAKQSNSNIQFHNYTAKQIKKSVTNTGTATKDEVDISVKKYFDLKTTFKTDHESDAGAVIITYLNEHGIDPRRTI